MSTWFRPVLSSDEQAEVLYDREHHPNPIVRRKMLVLWAVHLGHTRQQAADIAHVGVATAARNITLYRNGGLDLLRQGQPRLYQRTELVHHTSCIVESLTEKTVRTIAEATQRIHEITGIKRSRTQVRIFLASLGFTWQRLQSIPVPPKKR